MGTTTPTFLASSTLSFQPSAVDIVPKEIHVVVKKILQRNWSTWLQCIHCGHMSFADSALSQGDHPHVQPEPVQLQCSPHHQQFPHFLPFVDQCSRWLCLLLVSWIQRVLTHYSLLLMARLLCLPLSIEVASECVPRIHPKVSYQLATVQQHSHLALAISSSRVSHDPLHPFPTILALGTCTLPNERPKLCYPG